MSPQATKLIEECSEVIHALCKIERFGMHAVNPETGETNRCQLRSEIEGLMNAISAYELVHRLWDGLE